jgi:hypothetical protein
MAEDTIALSDAQAVEYGFPPASTGESAPVTPEAQKEVPATPKAAAVTAPTADKSAESVSPKASDDTSKEGAKPLYTPDEIKSLLKDAEATGKINLDTSRLDPTGIALMKSFQQGLNPSFERAKREREEAVKMKQDAERIRAEFEQAKRDAENKRLYEKEAEEVGEEEAKRREIERQRDERIERLENENRQAQNRATAFQIKEEYRQTASKFFIPQDQFYEDAALSFVINNDMLRLGKGEFPKSIEESVAMYADKFGFTNVDNLWKIIRANPDNEKAIANYYVNDYIQRKAKGPIVSPSTVANVQTPKPPTEKMDLTKSTIDLVREQLGIPAGEEIKLI